MSPSLPRLVVPILVSGILVLINPSKWAVALAIGVCLWCLFYCFKLMKLCAEYEDQLYDSDDESYRTNHYESVLKTNVAFRYFEVFIGGLIRIFCYDGKKARELSYRISRAKLFTAPFRFVSYSCNKIGVFHRHNDKVEGGEE